MIDRETLSDRTRLIRLADEDIERYRHLKASTGKSFRTFLEGAASLYERAGLGRKSRSIRRLIKWAEGKGFHA